MSSTPDEVSRLLARTRANRDRINKHLEGIGESPHPIRSPLKERQQQQQENRTTPTKIRTTFSPAPAAKKTPTRPTSPSRIRTTTTTTVTTTRPPSVELAEEATEDTGVEKKKETFDREVTETRTTIEDSPVRDGDREFVKKTTITEKEEKIHKTQVIGFDIHSSILVS